MRCKNRSGVLGGFIVRETMESKITSTVQEKQWYNEGLDMAYITSPTVQEIWYNEGLDMAYVTSPTVQEEMWYNEGLDRAYITSPTVQEGQWCRDILYIEGYFTRGTMLY
ncbi:hypothetical protein CHS0354_006507 [Potamilus streckersoni]|uniref:Uncharacterized protein n=1 Tax=Potamilus streckersoni TaxID=2493646 RepID=A0AAE0TAE6_9BIVA|nr:hypothetical protein CHS0354_006507 [Potamilus streckersoni]